MSINSRQKGAAGERELSHKLKEYGYEARRGQQYCGSNGDADVIGLPGVHIECKRVEKLNIDAALQQAIHDASDHQNPAVFQPDWKVTIRLEDFMKLYDESCKRK